MNWSKYAETNDEMEAFKIKRKLERDHKIVTIDYEDKE